MRRLLICAALGSLTVGLLVNCVGDAGAPGGSGTDGSAGNPDGASSTTDGGNPSAQDSGGAGAKDGGGIDGSAVDSGDAGRACDPTRPFGAPTKVTAVNSADNDEVATLSPDELELFVSTYPAGQVRKIKRYARADKQSPWLYKDTADSLSIAEGGAPTSATGLTFEPDGLIAYFQFYDKVGSSNSSIFTTSRAALNTGLWSMPVEVSSLSDNFSDETPFLTADGKTLFFFSSRAGGFHIFYADKGGNGFVAPTAAFKVTPTDDRYPVLTGDQLTMYLGSYGAIDGGAPAMQIFKATRDLKTHLFDPPVYVPELNVNGSFTGPSWVSQDGCHIVLFSIRAGGAGGTDVYEAFKPK